MFRLLCSEKKIDRPTFFYAQSTAKVLSGQYTIYCYNMQFPKHCLWHIYPFILIFCAHVNPISVCRKRVGLTAGSMKSWKHCTHEKGKRKEKKMGSAVLWLLAFPWKAARIVRAWHWDWSHNQTWHGNYLRHGNASHVNYIDFDLHSRSHIS